MKTNLKYNSDLRALRIELGMSQDKAARLLEIDPRNYRRWEEGVRNLRRWEFLGAKARFVEGADQ